MGKFRESTDFDILAKNAKEAENNIVKMKGKVDQLDKKVVELQKVWKSQDANKIYKKLKGNINNNYDWINKVSTLNDKISSMAE